MDPITTLVLFTIGAPMVVAYVVWWACLKGDKEIRDQEPRGLR